MKKRVLLLLIAVCFVAGLLPAIAVSAKEAASGTCGDNLTWVLSEDGTLTISGTGRMHDYYFFDSVALTSAPWANYFDSIKNIEIEDGVTSIGEAAFALCTNSRNVSISDSVTSIGNSAFYKCPITSIVIPDSVTNIGNEAFSFSGLTSVTIPDSVTNIGRLAFFTCRSLSQIKFEGDSPNHKSDGFTNVTATAYYPANNPTWTREAMQKYDGTITWVPYTPSLFTDVPEGSFYYDPVMWAVENGITTGTSDTTFSPDNPCQRAAVVTFLWRAAGEPEPTSNLNPFVDVKESDFFYKAVLWAVEEGITNGTDATHFSPYAVCNRAAVVTFLHRAMGSPAPESTANPFTDVDEKAFYYVPMLWAVENGITNGLTATTFGPTADCNRAQIVTFLYRAYN